jgi:hypothetical protein
MQYYMALFGIDFSALSPYAARRAATHRAPDGEVVLVHVVRELNVLRDRSIQPDPAAGRRRRVGVVAETSRGGTRGDLMSEAGRDGIAVRPS